MSDLGINPLEDTESEAALAYAEERRENIRTFVRTSPDHGTAFDIAGTGKADAASLITALGYAERLIAARNTGVS